MRSSGSEIFLIVNADDFNLTPGVSRGILRAYDTGVVTNTSVLINLPLSRPWLKEFKARKKLGAGLHLNVTLDRPVSNPREIPSLVDSQGCFKRRTDLDSDRISKKELEREYDRQIRLFRKVFGQWPTHLDTHHHLHENKAVFDVMAGLALHYRLPIRQSRFVTSKVRRKFLKEGITLTDRLVEDLDPHHAWNAYSLHKVLRSLKAGLHELMCHPALCDRQLVKRSSFNHPREEELRALCSREVRSLVKKKGIRLISFRNLRLY